MKYLIILLALSLNACAKSESFYSKNCIYNNWEDGQNHCNRYNLVVAPKKVPLYYRNQHGWYRVWR